MSFIERRQRISDTDAPLLLLEIKLSSQSETLYLVNDTVNVTSGGREYVAYPFQFKAPDEVSGSIPQAQLEIGNVGSSLTEDLEKFNPGDVVSCVVKVTDRQDPNYIFSTLSLPLTSVNVNPTTVSATAGWGSLLEQRATLIVSNPFTTPGVF